MGIEFHRIPNLAIANLNLITCPICKLVLNNPALCGIC